MRVEFTIPGEPVPKGRPRATTVGGRARLYTPGKTTKYEQLVALAAQQAMDGDPPTGGPVVLMVHAYLPIPASKPNKVKEQMREGAMLPTKKPDLDNIIKAVQDGLNQVAYQDDKQIVSLYTTKRYSDTPRIDVKVYSCGLDQQDV